MTVDLYGITSKHPKPKPASQKPHALQFMVTTRLVTLQILFLDIGAVWRELWHDMSQDEINETEWNKQENWSFFAYRSRSDNRFFVPKRRGVGVTINFGHKSAVLYIIGFMALILSPLIIALVGVALKG